MNVQPDIYKAAANPISKVVSAGGCTLLRGAFPDTGLHRNPSICLLVGREKPVAVETKGHSSKGDGFIVESAIEHSVRFDGGQCFVIYVEAPHLSSLNAGRHCGKPLPREIVKVVQDHGDNWTEAASVELLSRLQHASAIARRSDEKIDRIVSAIGAAPCLRMSQKEACAISHLERTTMLRRFKRKTGMTFRGYKSWVATKHAIRLVEAGQSIQDAAFDSGFYDAPHFSRTFKNLFGLSPSQAST